MLYIKKYQNNNSKNAKAYGKWYGRVIHLERIDLDGLCDHIQGHGSIFTADVVQGTVKKFMQCIIELLLEGKKVRLNGLGTFYLSIDSSGTDTQEDYSVQNVKKVRLRFKPEQSEKSNYSTSQITRMAKVTTNLPGSTSGTSNSGSGSGHSGGNGGGGVEEEP